MIKALEVDENIGESGSEVRENVNISNTIHAIYAQMGTILCLINEHIVSKHEVHVNRTVTFWDIAKKSKFRELEDIFKRHDI